MKHEEFVLTEEELEHIEAILTEASAFGLRWEVDEYAKRYLEEGETNDPVQAYDWAFQDWCK